MEQTITSEIFLSDKKIDGTITNTLGYSLEDAYVYSNGIYVHLGELPKDATILLNDCNRAYGNNSDSVFYDDNEITQSIGGTGDKMSQSLIQKANSIGFIYNEYLIGQSGAYLIGFTSEIQKESPIYELAHSKASSGTNVIIIPLTLRTDENSREFIPCIDTYLQDKSYLFWERENRYVYSNMIELDYEIPKKLRMTNLMISELFQVEKKQDEYTNSHCGRIYFYNWANNRYDLIFDLESEYTLNELDMSSLVYYIDENQKMRIKFESGNADSSIFVLPVISCYVEETHVTN